MKGVITAGGLGTRLYPLTYATNKHLLPIYDEPMIHYPIHTLVSAGIKDILVIVGGPHAGHFLRVLKNGKHLGVRHLEFVYQENEGGIAQALSLAEDFADNNPVTVVLGDNTMDGNIGQFVKTFRDGACVFLKKVPDPARYGVPVFNKQRQITKIEEKPKNPKSPYAVIGMYIYDNQVFKIIKSLKPSARGELEITEVNNAYLKMGKLQWRIYKEFWTDAGKFETLFVANKYWADRKGFRVRK